MSPIGQKQEEKQMEKLSQVADIVKKFIPKPHNRIAIMVIFGGLSLVVDSFTMQLVEKLAVKYLGLSDFGPGNWIVGLVLVFGGLIYHTFMIWINKPVPEDKSKTENQRNHDLEMFKRIDAVFNEQRHEWIEYYVGDNHQIYSEQINQLMEVIQIMKRRSNDFSDSELNASKKRFSEALEKFYSFISLNFFPYGKTKAGSENTRYCLFPQGNADRTVTVSEENRSSYDQYSKELNEVLNCLEKDYQEFRLLVKAKLLV